MKQFFIVLVTKLLASALAVLGVYLIYSFLEWNVKEPNWEVARTLFVMAFILTFLIGKNSEENDD